ncbi:MAG: ATP-binding protein [Capsulimonadales bacterium]|nr:ATP-binding protein [Capsulimonadales bacterium]
MDSPETSEADRNRSSDLPMGFDADTTGDSLADVLVDAISDGVLRVDPDGVIVAVNRNACRLFGVREYPPPPGEMIQQTLLEATHLRALTELHQEAQRTGVPGEADVRQVGRFERLLRVRALPLPPPSTGETLFILTDLTEISHLRTVRSEFVANVSHELRTPLASIRATAETLLEGAVADPEYGRRFLETIIREADRLVRLSEDLLELSRAESSRRQRVRFDLHDLIVEAASRLLVQAERRGITLHLPPSPAAPILIDADPSEIDQVVFNLVDNAIKYTPGGGKVTIGIVPLFADNKVTITVADTGIGILSQDLPRIFERFWRADRARRFQNSKEGSGTGGTGLGLSIVKHIVEAHGGSVTAESELGQGSRFTLLLPLVAPDIETTSER